MAKVEQRSLSTWKSDGELVAKHLQCQDMEDLAPSEKERIFQYYLPVYYWLLDQLAQHQANLDNSSRPMVVRFATVIHQSWHTTMQCHMDACITVTNASSPPICACQACHWRKLVAFQLTPCLLFAHGWDGAYSEARILSPAGAVALSDINTRVTASSTYSACPLLNCRGGQHA